jgi:hypothetical protein
MVRLPTRRYHHAPETWRVYSGALEKAAAADQRARDTADQEVRLDNERLAQSWRLLARSFQFVESLEQFLIDYSSKRNLLPPLPPEQK